MRNRTLSRLSDVRLALCMGAAVLMAVSVTACAPRTSIDAEALDGMMGNVLTRHDAYVRADPALSETERSIALRSSAMVRALIDEALGLSDGEPAPLPAPAPTPAPAPEPLPES